jgi:hypothetical protein
VYICSRHILAVNLATILSYSRHNLAIELVISVLLPILLTKYDKPVINGHYEITGTQAGSPAQRLDAGGGGQSSGGDPVVFESA